MNIGIIANPWLGGAGALPTELGKILSSRGHKIHFFAFDIPFRLIGPWRKNIYFHKIESYEYAAFNNPADSLTMANTIYSIAKREKIQILNAHFAGPHSEAIYLAKNMLKEDGYDIKIVTTLHGSDVSILGNEVTIKDSISFLLKSSDAITSVSHSLAKDAQELYQLKDINVIHNFVNTNEFKPLARAEDLRSFFAKDEEKIIFHSSNFRSVKRIQDVIQIFNLINKKHPSKLLLAGEGPDQQIATKLAAKFNIINRIHFLGIQTNMQKLLAISDIFLLPSEKENFSLSALEAMSMGVPVVASNVGGMSEMIEDSVDGFLCNVGDVQHMSTEAIRILTDNNLHKKMSDLAIKKVQDNFSHDKIIPQYESFYKELLNNLK